MVLEHSHSGGLIHELPQSLRVCRAALLGLLVLTGCQTQRVTVNGQDGSPPEVQTGSINLVPEIGLGQSRAQSNPAAPSLIEQVASFPANRSEATFSISAQDPESGIRRARVSATLRVWCISGWGDSQPAIETTRQLDGPEVSFTPDTQGALPKQAFATLTLDRTTLTAACPGKTVADFEWVANGSATNGANLRGSSLAMRVVRPVSVVAANIWAPCLRQLEAQGTRDLAGQTLCDGLHVQQPGVGPTLSHLNEQLDRWGRYFATKDVVLISELDVTEARWLDRVRQSAPAHFIAHRGMTVILSRWPLTNISDARSATTFVGVNPIQSEYVRAVANTPRGPIDVFAVHWAHRPAPVVTSPERTAFAQSSASQVLALPLNRWAVMGGDFNAKSVWMPGPDELEVGDDATRADIKRQFRDLGGRSQPEIAAIEAVMRDARREVWETAPDQWAHLNGPPIDFVWLRGPINAVRYTNDTGQFGSDHSWLHLELIRR
ncbi:MAG: endonuclease/exonuclease/phosphatase family protein [Burkholderiales bacterium]|nr:endonuclease/exonuclease/phosphatase family protein [Burkholderiales bacterium]